MWRLTVRGLVARRLRLALTALAIVVGVMFVSGTLVLTDTLNSTFATLFGQVYQHVSFEIRGTATLPGTAAAIDSTADRRPVPQSLAQSIRALPGVADAVGSVGGYAQFVAPDGKAIGKGAGSTLGFSFDPDRELASVHLVAGRAPSGPDDVLMDEATASASHFHIGERVRVLLPRSSETFTLTGIVAFGDDDELAGATLAGFDLPTAQRLFHAEGSYDTINVLAKPGANLVALQRAIAAALPTGVQVVGGRTVANELSSAVDNELSFISKALLVFASISLVVGAFTIYNTFSITVAQRTRELALLRVIGAGRRQLFASVLTEAALTGLVAALVGLGPGVAAAAGLEALLRVFGITLPSAPLVFEPRTAIAAIALGVGVTVAAAIGPALRVVRVPPLAALAEQGSDRRAPGRRRLIAAGATATAGLAAVALGASRPAIDLVGVGAVCVLVAAGLLAPFLAGPIARTLGFAAGRLIGVPGRLGRENSARNPYRTAQTAAALTVGLAVVSTVAVLGASLSRSASASARAAISADEVITAGGGFSGSVAPTVSHLPGIGAVATIYQGQFELDGSLATLTAAPATALRRTVRLALSAGSAAPALADGELLVDTTTAAARHLRVGSVVPVTFAQTGATTMRVGGIFARNALIGSFVVGDGFFLRHFDHPLPVALLVSAGGPAASVERALERALAAYPNLTIRTRSQFVAAQQQHVDELLGLVDVLLALAVVVALIGIVNTLVLSVFERTREIGLLRAVGMRRGQVGAMIRCEAVIIALFGAIVGVAIGSGLGVALAASLRDQGVGVVAVPLPSLAIYVALSALLGLRAASWPARRAARLDMLAALATA